MNNIFHMHLNVFNNPITITYMVLELQSSVQHCISRRASDPSGILQEGTSINDVRRFLAFFLPIYPSSQIRFALVMSDIWGLCGPTYLNALKSDAIYGCSQKETLAKIQTHFTLLVLINFCLILYQKLL